MNSWPCTGDRRPSVSITARSLQRSPLYTGAPSTAWRRITSSPASRIRTYIERFNRSYRTEVLNAHLFESIAELRALTIEWLRIYNQERPHDSLGRVPPLTFLPRPTTAEQSPWELSA